MPRLEFLTDFACLGQFFNVLVEISPEYWCVPSIWSSQYHGDWHEVLIKFLPGLSSADISSKQVQQGWPNRGSSFTDHWGDSLITVIWYWLWNFPITLKQSGYLFTISPLTLRSGFLHIPYCEGVPVSGVAPSGFGPSASVTKKVATDFRP